jgi:hypothetical protein
MLRPVCSKKVMSDELDIRNRIELGLIKISITYICRFLWPNK